MLSFRFADAFLLRLGACRLSALLFHPPPRRTAWYGLRPRLRSLHSQAFCGKQ